MRSGRTDTHTLVVSNDTTGQRFSWVGSKKECEEAAAQQVKAWGKAKCRYEIIRR